MESIVKQERRGTDGPYPDVDVVSGGSGGKEMDWDYDSGGCARGRKGNASTVVAK